MFQRNSRLEADIEVMKRDLDRVKTPFSQPKSSLNSNINTSPPLLLISLQARAHASRDAQLVELHVTFARDMSLLRERLAAIQPPPPGAPAGDGAGGGGSGARSQAEFFSASFAAVTAIEQER